MKGTQEATPVYRFVQVADIHFGQEQDGQFVVQKDIRDGLLKDVTEVVKTRGPANMVIIVGDTAYSGKAAEYHRAGEWLDTLTRVVKCRETDVRLVPGNHDCDRDLVSDQTRAIHQKIRRGTPKSAHAELQVLSRDTANPLMPKIAAYRDFSASYESDFDSISRPLWTKSFPLSGGIILRLVGMSSVQVSDDEDWPGKMILGNAQYILPDEDCVVYAVVVHHPIEWYKDRAEAKQYLHNRARIIMVGHEHIPNVSKSTDGLGTERLDIYSGAVTPPDDGALYRFTYNWLEISIRPREERGYVLLVNIFPRVWVPEKMRFVADIQCLEGSESAKFEISCPALKPCPSEKIDHTSTEKRILDALSGDSIADNPDKNNIAQVMATEDNPGLAKLKYLFWRYLDWRQRLDVLVKADVLPSSAVQPVPQTMERLALERAQQQDKLSEVWDAIMVHIQEDKRSPNPFNTVGS